MEKEFYLCVRDVFDEVSFPGTNKGTRQLKRYKKVSMDLVEGVQQHPKPQHFSQLFDRDAFSQGFRPHRICDMRNVQPNFYRRTSRS